MKYILEVFDYDHRIQLDFDPDAVIESSHSEYGETVIKANREGLISLAKILLTLAQENVPSGAHVHMDAFNFLEEGSQELILVRWDNFENNEEKSKNNA